MSEKILIEESKIIRLIDTINPELASKLLYNIHVNYKGCWIRGNDSTIYTSIKWDNKMQRAHRLLYEIVNNVIIPSNLIACHKCDTPACINPEHIFIGTTATNNQDARRKGRAFSIRIKGSKWNEFPKLRQAIRGY